MGEADATNPVEGHCRGGRRGRGNDSGPGLGGAGRAGAGRRWSPEGQRVAGARGVGRRVEWNAGHRDPAAAGVHRGRRAAAVDLAGRRCGLDQACAGRAVAGPDGPGRWLVRRRGDLRRRHRRRERDRPGVRLGIRARRGGVPRRAERPVLAPPGLAFVQPDSLGFLSFDPAAIPTNFAQDLPVAEARVLAAARKPIAARCFADPAGVPAWKPCHRGAWSPPRTG